MLKWLLFAVWWLMEVMVSVVEEPRLVLKGWELWTMKQSNRINNISGLVKRQFLLHLHHFHDFQWKLTLCYRDPKVLVWIWEQRSLQTTSVPPWVGCLQLCDGHIQDCRCEWIKSFCILKDVSSYLLSVVGCSNENVSCWTVASTEDPLSSRESKWIFKCDGLSFSCWVCCCCSVSIQQSSW